MLARGFDEFAKRNAERNGVGVAGRALFGVRRKFGPLAGGRLIQEERAGQCFVAIVGAH